jgi:hypothetical protein
MLPVLKNKQNKKNRIISKLYYPRIKRNMLLILIRSKSLILPTGMGSERRHGSSVTGGSQRGPDLRVMV